MCSGREHTRIAAEHRDLEGAQASLHAEHTDMQAAHAYLHAAYTSLHVAHADMQVAQACLQVAHSDLHAAHTSLQSGQGRMWKTLAPEQGGGGVTMKLGEGAEGRDHRGKNQRPRTQGEQK